MLRRYFQPSGDMISYQSLSIFRITISFIILLWLVDKQIITNSASNKHFINNRMCGDKSGSHAGRYHHGFERKME